LPFLLSGFATVGAAKRLTTHGWDLLRLGTVPFGNLTGYTPGSSVPYVPFSGTLQ
jgi:hypothetical protein